MNFNQETQFLLNKFSHELRNPLTTLYSTVQLIELQHPEVKDFKYWPSITHDIEYMDQLLKELSDYAKSTHLHSETFALRPFLEGISLSFAASIAHSDVEYTSQIDPSITQITGDKTKLQEVFRNLLKNAFEAATPDKTIRLTAIQENEHIVITIQDTGVGISKEQLPTIFEPFITYKKNGTGLGLSISDQIIKAHGGSICAESEPGVGTTFRIRLRAM